MTWPGAFTAVGISAAVALSIGWSESARFYAKAQESSAAAEIAKLAQENAKLAASCGRTDR